MKRADGRCEFCGSGWAPFEWHHMEGGSGRRREKESEQNTAAICQSCHKGWHHYGPAASFILLVKQWAERHGYPLPSIIRKAEASAQLPGRAAR
jgi:hypothetical protein